MKIIRRIPVPTGDILIVEGEHGPLEMLSLGDYGKDVNVKCAAMGLDRDPGTVVHQKLLPLEEKWVITISTQYGCSMNCAFCDVPLVGRGVNATLDDLIRQVMTGIKLHPEVQRTRRMNIHFARMGEPTWNPDVLDATRYLSSYVGQIWGKHPNPIHPVVSTMMPRRNIWLKTFIKAWMDIKNDLLQGEAGLQLSINSTDESRRFQIFDGNAHSIEDIAIIMDDMRPVGRKITLNFAVAKNWEIDPAVLLRYFNPSDYLVKLTPMHRTGKATQAHIETAGDYTTLAPYADHESALRKAGYDVLVFIASREEDEGRITCGNAILSGTEPFGAGVKP